MLTCFRKLINRCLAGDQSAMSELVGQYQSRVYALCFRMLGHRQDAEDATQQTFLRVLRNLSRWDPQREFEPWLFAIAGNRCRTALSARWRKWRTVSLTDPIADSAATSTAHHLAEEVELVLRQLRPEYQQAFRLFHYEELCYEEIAQRLQRPVGTVKTWIHRARLEMVRHLRERGVVEGVARSEVVASAADVAPGEAEHAMR